MRYYIDTEFWERPIYWHRGDKNPAGAGIIDLISIAVVAEDGRELYCENKLFHWGNLATAAYDRGAETAAWLIGNVRPHLQGGDVEWSPADIRDQILSLVTVQIKGGDETVNDPNPEFWGYFCDYDWVVFCWLFGRMIDLPPHFPKHCLDLKQEMKRLNIKREQLPAQDEKEHHALADARRIRNAHQALLTYRPQVAFARGSGSGFVIDKGYL